MKATLDNGEVIDIHVEPEDYITDVIVVARSESLKEPGKDKVLLGSSKNLGVIKTVGMLSIALEYQSIFNDEDEGD